MLQQTLGVTLQKTRSMWLLSVGAQAGWQQQMPFCRQWMASK